MHLWWQMLSRLRAVFRHRRNDRDLDQEMEAYRALLVGALRLFS